jgi:hypothetical protein
VRQITLAAREDVLEEMADPWSKYLDAIHDCHDQLAKIWADDLEKNWKGEAANACHDSWIGLEKKIAEFGNNYAPIIRCFSSARGAVKDATYSIPVPVFSGNRLPGHRAANPPDGPTMYDDYQDNRQEYADYAFRDQALGEVDQEKPIQGVRVRKGKSYTTGDAPSPSETQAMLNRERELRKAAVETWYSTNQATANSAHDKLVADYSEIENKLPQTYGKFRTQSDGGDKKTEDGHHGGGGDGSDLSYGAGAFGSVGGAGVGAGAVHGSLPATKHVSLPSPPSSISDGIRLAGDQDSAGVGPVGSTGLSGSGSSSRLPLSWSTAPAGGSGGAGSFGAVGAGGVGGGFGGMGVPSTSVPEDGWWSRPRSGAVGPAASSPTAQLAAARGGSSAAGSTGGVGMMPHGGTSGNRQRDERQTWLTEDDEDIFRAKPATPGLIE